MVCRSAIVITILWIGLPLAADAQQGGQPTYASRKEFYEQFFRVAQEPEDVPASVPVTLDVSDLPGDTPQQEVAEASSVQVDDEAPTEPPAEIPSQIHSRSLLSAAAHSDGCSRVAACESGSCCGCSSTFRGSSLGCNKCCRRHSCGGLGIDLGGWLGGGNTINSHGLRTPNGNEPMGFNNYANGWVLNQAWLWAERAADTGGCGFDWGFRCDFMFGADGPDTTAFGDQSWDFDWQTSSQYGFAMPQLYGELMFNKTKVKIGHFYTMIGYEVVQMPDNFFYSHALTMYYNEPFTHTGVLAERPVGERMTWYAGWTMGWDSGFDNRHDGSTFLGGVSTEFTDDFTLIWATTFGDRGFDSTTYMQSLVADVALSEYTSYVFQTDWQTTDFGAGYEDAYGVNQYLIHTINDCWAAGTRLEWFRDDAGTYVGNGRGNYWGLTAGLNRTGWRGIVNRLECRYDWFDGDGRPYARNTKRSQLTIGTSTYVAF